MQFASDEDGGGGGRSIVAGKTKQRMKQQVKPGSEPGRSRSCPLLAEMVLVWLNMYSVTFNVVRFVSFGGHRSC